MLKFHQVDDVPKQKCNHNQLSIQIGEKYIVRGYQLKLNQTLFIDDLGIPIMPGESLRVHGSYTGVNGKITGYETLTDGITSYRPSGLTDFGVGVPATSKDRLLKSLIITNISTFEVKAGLRIGDNLAFSNMIIDYSIPVNNSIIIPSMDLFLPAGGTINVQSSVLNGMVFHMALKDVN